MGYACEEAIYYNNTNIPSSPWKVSIEIVLPGLRGEKLKWKRSYPMVRCVLASHADIHGLPSRVLEHLHGRLAALG